MRRMLSPLRLAGCFLLVLVAIGPSPALAADEPAAPIERGYTISYLLVAVLAGLGVAATCKSAYRHAKEETI